MYNFAMLSMKNLHRYLIFGTIVFSFTSPVADAQKIERDVPYGPLPEQKLDLSLPAAKGFPTVVFVHGGSLSSGDKSDEDYGKVCLPFVAAKIACANVNYRLAPKALWPAQAEDVAAVIAWVKQNISVRGGDPGKLFIFGHSSGAMLVALIGSDESYLLKRGMHLSELRGVLPMGSIMWDVELQEAIASHGQKYVDERFLNDPDDRMYGSLASYQAHWPINHVHKGLPPFLFLIAESEQEQPPVLKTDQKFIEEARKLGNKAEFRVLKGRTHYSAIRKLSEPDDPTFGLILEFMHRQSDF